MSDVPRLLTCHPDYGCALQREILVQGRIYISENHICFHANIFGWVTDVRKAPTLERPLLLLILTSLLAHRDGLSEDEASGRPALDASHTLGTASPTESGALSIGSVVPPTHKATTCACGREGKHYSELAIDTVIPGTPDRIYNLMFASGFLKDFMRENQKLEGKFQYIFSFPSVANGRVHRHPDIGLGANTR